MSPRRRDGLDRGLAGLGRALQASNRLAPRLVRLGLIAVGAVAVPLFWPWLPTRGRVRRSGLGFRPWVWGAFLGTALADGLGGGPEPPIEGMATLHGGGLVLAGHLGSWEAAAVALGRQYAVLGIAAPWPRLPRTQRWLAELRRSRGVRTVVRGRAGWREATRHLRAGGVVVVLMDSASPHRPGRRARPSPGGAIAAPDALVSWARRQGRPVVVAEPGPAFRLRALEAPAIEAAADEAVDVLVRAIRSRPERWAWVQALGSWALGSSLLGSWALALSMLSALPGCASPAYPPLPLDPGAWTGDATDVRWDGEPVDGVRGSLRARSARLRWVDGGPAGRFVDVELTWVAQDGPEGVPRAAQVSAASAVGSWPDGPLALSDVGWIVDGLADGEVDAARWDGAAGFGCGGCALEALDERLIPGHR